MKKGYIGWFAAVVGSFMYVSAAALGAADLNWQACSIDPSFDCASMEVPLDYTDPSLGTTHIPVAIHKAKKEKIGTLVYKAGGPWEDDADLVQELYPYLSSSLTDHFDLVGFTPRGVTPNSVTCTSHNMTNINELNRQMHLTDLSNDSGASQYYDLVTAKRERCNYDAIDQHTQTKETVQDLERLRIALGVDEINYYGESYGTRLGLAYLVAYPDHVRRMVLDGITPPMNSLPLWVENVSMAMEKTLGAFFDFCKASQTQCPLYHGGKQDFVAQFKILKLKAGAQGIPTSAQYSHRPFTLAMLMDVVTDNMGLSLYWPSLAEALNQAITENNADLLMQSYMDLRQYDPASDIFSDAQYNVDNDAVFPAVFCRDYDITRELDNKQAWMRTTGKVRKDYPLAGGFWGGFFAQKCIDWPEKSDPLLPEHVGDIGPNDARVLLVSNAYDPITPKDGGATVKRYLGQRGVEAQRLTWLGAGHVAYKDNAPDNGCVEKNVNGFLSTGDFPQQSTCNDGTNPFLMPTQSRPGG